MGNFLSLPIRGSEGSKRKRDDESTDQGSSGVPQRKKLYTTAEYIYRTLFVEGQNSDVTIVALGMEWRLHKIYLCQSAYFSSMFNGGWREGSKTVIRIGIEDPRITRSALRTAFGALYLDEVAIRPDEVVSVLAAATLFQMDGLINMCCEIMEESISRSTVQQYYATSTEYGSLRLKEKCVTWFEKNLMYSAGRNAAILRHIEANLMKALVESPRLVVIQSEFSLYLLLLAWIFLRHHGTWEGDLRTAENEARSYFRERTDNGSFLESVDGEEYLEVFKALRAEDLIINPQDIDSCEADNVLPKSMLGPAFRKQWRAVLRVDHGLDAGPSAVSEEIFNKHCRRCGYILSSDIRHVWRWAGYNFGMDVLVTYHKIVLKFRRNDWNEYYVLRCSSSTARRKISYRVVVYSIDPSGEARQVCDTGISSLTFSRGAEKQVLIIRTDNVYFPLIISAGWMITAAPGEDAEVAAQ